LADSQRQPGPGEAFVIGPPLIQIRNLRFRYPNSDGDVLRIPGLDVSGRGMTAITGPSGVGKSTLIELLAGTLRGPYEGSLVVLGLEWKELTSDRQRQRQIRRIGFIPQDYGLLTDRTPVDMLQQDLADAGVRREERQARITSALTALQLQDCYDRLVGTMSGGQRQRVAIHSPSTVHRMSRCTISEQTQRRYPATTP
jgi:ABC-type methionine transport system ATPase subunit